MSEMIPGNLENQLAEAREEIAELRELLEDWSNMFGNHALGGPVQGKELMKRTREVLGMNDDFDFRLHDGHKIVLQPTHYLHLYVDGKYYGFYESEQRAMQIYEEQIKPKLEAA